MTPPIIFFTPNKAKLDTSFIIWSENIISNKFDVVEKNFITFLFKYEVFIGVITHYFVIPNKDKIETSKFLINV